jgi:hypothetical protein
MSTQQTLDQVFAATNTAFELIFAGTAILSRISAAQEARKASGTELTAEDIKSLMDSGDIKAALLKGSIAIAKAKAGG